MNILKGTKSYLIGPMEYKNGEAWRVDMTEFLSKRGIVSFDPYKKPFINAVPEDSLTQDFMRMLMKGEKPQLTRNEQYDIVSRHFKVVRSFDLSMVDKSDFIICYLCPSTPTFGTMEELSWAVRLKRPVFIVMEGGKENTPLWVMGMLPHKYIYNSFDEVKEMLANIDDGKTKIDSCRWRLLKPELR